MEVDAGIVGVNISGPIARRPEKGGNQTTGNIFSLRGLREHKVSPDVTTCLRGCRGCGSSSAQPKLNNMFSELIESDEEPPTRTDSEDEAPEKGKVTRRRGTAAMIPKVMRTTWR